MPGLCERVFRNKAGKSELNLISTGKECQIKTGHEISGSLKSG